MLGATLAVERAGLPATAGEVEMPLERLEAEIGDPSGRLVAQECRWLELLSALDPKIEAVFMAPARPSARRSW